MVRRRARTGGTDPDVVAYASGPAGPIAYRDTGTDHADTMVFVHGLNMASGVWDEVIARLPSFRCLALDLRGHGRSVRHGPYGVDDYIADVSAVLAATSVVNVQMVGVSLGGLVSCALAQRRPGLVRSAVALGSGLVAQHSDLEAGMARLRAVGVADYFSSSLPRGSLPANATQQVRDRLVGFAVTGREDTTMIEKIIRSTFEQDLGHVLTGPVESPVLVVNGDLDTTYPAEQGLALAAATGGRWQPVAGAGHVIPLEQPATCADLLASFYRQPDAALRRSGARGLSR